MCKKEESPKRDRSKEPSKEDRPVIGELVGLARAEHNGDGDGDEHADGEERPPVVVQTAPEEQKQDAQSAKKAEAYQDPEVCLVT